MAFESLFALSVILDLANGLAEDKSLLTCAFAYELAQDAGCSHEEAWAAAMTALLRHLGCTAFASVEAEVVANDIALRGRLHRSDSSKASDVLRAVAGASNGMRGAGRNLLKLVATLPELRHELAFEACDAAQLLSDGLKLGPQVRQGLSEVFERHDGTGAPRNRSAEEISTVGRIANVAHVSVVFALEGGTEEARKALRIRAGNMLDPQLAKRAERLVAALSPAPAEYLATRRPILEAVAAQQASLCVEDVAKVFGDFADLQAPLFRGHSRAVAELTAATCEQLRIAPDETREAVLAAHLHDLGQVAIPTSIWTSARVYGLSERERAHAHVYFTERILASAQPLAGVARIAGAHHERLDGSGYHRGLSAGALHRSARILAVCDVLNSMQEKRPHRPACTLAVAAVELKKLSREAKLDTVCVDAALGASGLRSHQRRAAFTTLSTRELEVLRLVSQGNTNKAIARTLGISARTVQHHTIHIYQKLGVETRAGAALVAAQQGLLSAL